MEKDGKRIQSRSKARETFCLPYLQCTLLGLAILAFSTPLVTLVSMDRFFRSTLLKKPCFRSRFELITI